MTRMVRAIGLRLGSAGLAAILAAMLIGAALPDSGQIAFASAADGDYDIYLMDINRGIIRNLTNDPENELHHSWSPDGEQLVFASEHNGLGNLYLMNVDCGGWFALCTPRRPLIEDNNNNFDPAWSPDGSTIAYTSLMAETGSYEIMRVAAKGGEPQPLTNSYSLDVNPAWSPDGGEIAFASNRGEAGDTDLFVMDANGDHVRRILDKTNNDSSPAWSPDGRRLLYVTGDQSYRQVALLDLESGQSTPLLDRLGDDDMPAWSPDGNTIALVSFRAGFNGELYTLRLDCTSAPEDCLHRLTFNDTLERDPAWRP